MAEQNGEKTQEPTPHRRQEARDQGEVARSADLASAVVLVAAIALLLGMGGSLSAYLVERTRRQLQHPVLSTELTELVGQVRELAVELGQVFGPLLATLFALAAAAELMQTGWLFVTSRLAPDINRINPVAGMQRLFSLAATVRLLMGLLKVAVAAAVAYAALADKWPLLLSLSAAEPAQLAPVLAELLLWTALKIAAALLILAAADYAFQRWKYEQDLRMTPQEVREELKNLQGDPHVIARRKAVQRQLAANRLKSAVPRAKVVVTNPTELAVALDYVPETMAAPIVVAKGAGLLAQQIRRLALEHGIPVVERKPLAQALYRDVEVGRPIPSQFYAAVAEVLAYVYQLKGGAPRTAA
ncbi:MAG: flagellar biosynthesis protein FlhB [Pirellulales bacterium]|nr:flagellar biosynthesis protein FlhB [Pirellulales bacterium]